LNPGAGTGREKMKKCLMPMASGSRTVVEHLAHDPKTEGSNPADCNRREKMAKKLITIIVLLVVFC
jgi:hypothetical protein